MYSTILSKKRIEERKRIIEKLHAKNLRDVKQSMDFQMKEVPESIQSHDSTHLASINKHKAAELLDPETTSKPKGETALKLHSDEQNGNENNMTENNINTEDGEETQNGGIDHYTAMQAFTWHWNALNYWGSLLSMQGFACYAAQPTGSVSWAPPITFLARNAVGHVPLPPAMAFGPNGGIMPYQSMPMYIPPTSNIPPPIASRPPTVYIPPPVASRPPTVYIPPPVASRPPTVYIPPPPTAGSVAQFAGTVPLPAGSATTNGSPTLQMSNAHYISMPVTIPATTMHDTPDDNSDAGPRAIGY